MDKNSLKELVKRYFGLQEVKEVVEAKFEEISLEDGSVVSNQKEEALAVGDILYSMVEGEAVAMSAGEVALPEGKVVVLDEAGVILEIKEKEEEMEEEVPAEEVVAEEAMSTLNAEDIISAIAEMVNGKFAEMETKMTDMNTKVEAFAKAPAVEKTILNKFSKTEEVTNPRYAKALSQLKNKK